MPRTMKPQAGNGNMIQALIGAVQCAATLVVLLGALGLIAWLAGIAALADIPWVLAGAFGGSLVMALIKQDARQQRQL